MKAIIILSFLSICSGLVLGQQKKPVTVKISTPDALCLECKKRIEEYLKMEDGVTKVIVYPNMKYTMVTFFEDRTDIEIIKTDIANCGYDADDIRAEESAYLKLPKTCKKVIDGGHGKKQ